MWHEDMKRIKNAYGLQISEIDFKFPPKKNVI